MWELKGERNYLKLLEQGRAVKKLKECPSGSWPQAAETNSGFYKHIYMNVYIHIEGK